MRKVFYFPNLAYGIGMRIFTFYIWKKLAKQAKSKYQTREAVFLQISKPIKIAEKSRRGVSDFLTQFKVFDTVLKHVCRVFDATFSKKVILNEKLKLKSEIFFIRFPEMSRFMMSLRNFENQVLALLFINAGFQQWPHFITPRSGSWEVSRGRVLDNTWR